MGIEAGQAPVKPKGHFFRQHHGQLMTPREMVDSWHFQPKEQPSRSPGGAAQGSQAPAPSRPRGAQPGEQGRCWPRTRGLWVLLTPPGGRNPHTSQRGAAARCKALLSLPRVAIPHPDLPAAAVDQQTSKCVAKEGALIVPFFADKEIEVSWNCWCSALRK